MKNGIILINKEKDKTSRDMVNELNHIFDMKKIGHTGTLDPLATGILVVCLGKYTRLVNKLSGFQKEYIATIKMGIKTDTLDITGNVLEERECHTTKEAVEKALQSLIGKQIQEIPIYSAKKINGKKLYEYAREGLTVNLPKNEIEIYEMELLDFKEEITFRALVSKGTYIRSLIDMLCNKLNIIGTMSALERTKQGKFSIEDSYTIDEVKEGKFNILKAKDVLGYSIYNLNEEEYLKVKNGNRIYLDISDKNIILMYNNEEVAIYIKEENYYKPDIMLNI